MTADRIQHIDAGFAAVSKSFKKLGRGAGAMLPGRLASDYAPENLTFPEPELFRGIACRAGYHWLCGWIGCAEAGTAKGSGSPAEATAQIRKSSRDFHRAVRPN